MRSRREILTAVGGGVAVVVATALLIWLLRPGTAGVPGTGGLASRQPRAAWLAALTLGAGVAFAYYVRTHQRRLRSKLATVVTTGCFALALLAVVAGIFWPGGLLRHTEPVPRIEPDAFTSTSLPLELDSTIPGETTAPVGTETTAPAGTEATVAPTPTSAPVP